MQHFWVHGVWIPVVAFLLGFQGKNLLFHSLALGQFSAHGTLRAYPRGAAHFAVFADCLGQCWLRVGAIRLRIVTPGYFHFCLLRLSGASMLSAGGDDLVTVITFRHFPSGPSSSRMRPQL